MAEKTELFLLLPISNDLEEDNHPFYIKRIDVIEDSVIEDFCKKMDEMIIFFGYENYYGYYDSNNIAAYMYPIDLLSEDFYPNKKRRLQVLFRRWGADWRKTAICKNTYSYLSTRIDNDTLSEIAERKIKQANNSHLLLNHFAIDRTSHIDIIDTITKQSLTVDILTVDITTTANWFTNNRKPQRIYRHNTKHGENGKGAHKHNKGDEVAVLLCSCDVAATLLNSAVSIFHNDKRMFAFDKTFNKYIEFKQESAYKYHGYHINDENIVPQLIRNKLNLL